MPIYEYECDKCGEIFEVFQKLSDPPPKKHSCGSRKVHRVMSRTSFVLKGTGWYITDYARKEKGHDGASGSNHKNKHSNDTPKSESPKTDSNKSEPSKSESGKKEKKDTQASAASAT